MKKLDSNQDKDSLLEELERLRKENKKLASQKDKIKAKYDKTKKELKKRRSEDNIDRRTKSITLEPVPGHRFPLIVIQLCVLIYMRTPCGLRTVVTILEIFAKLLGDTFGKVPCYNTVENWVKKLGLSVYQDDMSSWVFWGNEMLDCYDTLPEKIQEAYAFIKDYESLLKSKRIHDASRYAY